MLPGGANRYTPNMLTRIVKMTFREEAVPEFLELFQEVKNKIRSYSGCHHMELLRVNGQPNVLFTLSYWEDLEALNRYRQSTLFEQTWNKTKALFADKPEAWSLERIDPPSGQDGQGNELRQ